MSGPARAPLPLLVASLAMAPAGCHHRPAGGESVLEVCVPGNDNQIVSVSGYMTMSRELPLCAESTCALYLQADKELTNADAVRPIRVTFPVGQGHGQIAPLAEGFATSEIAVTGHDGKVARLSDPLRITGKLAVHDGYCSIRAPTRVEVP